ncbi:MAG: HAD family phosphatase [Sedimentisphaerales bacterium]|nr:HAD family phosphatase [Sedimentisphaerales bacterium]MBN2842498.1 HAD family phosphatase [Sedimentisphaerales bacterium]
MNKIEAIIFDLGRVLIDVFPERGIFGLICPDMVNEQEKLAAIMSDPAIELHNCGKIDSKELYRRINHNLSLDLSFNEFKTRWCNIFGPIPAMGKLLHELKGRYKLGLLSDTDPLHWEYARREYEYLSVFNNPGLSFNIGCCKPSVKSYLSACELVGVKPENALFIDDLPRNVEGARNVGMTAICHSSEAETRRQLCQLGIKVELAAGG